MPKKSKSQAMLLHFTSPRLSIEERFAAGKALREHVPRESHSLLPSPHPGRDPIAVLKAQAAKPRPGREVADRGRQAEIQALLDKVAAELK